jgi:dienelactone hydrolase
VVGHVVAGAILVAVAAGASACGGGSRATVTVEPGSATFDVPFTIRATGLPPGRHASVAFSGTAADGAAWRGRLTARTDAHGDLALPDEYLYARMHTTGGALGSRPQRVRVSVRVGGATATGEATRFPLATDSIETTDERPAQVGFYGEWVRPKHVGEHTAILLFGGSEGALTQGSLAETLAAHGYPVLHLAYFAEPGLPQSLRRVPLEYFEGALRWLARQPEVDPGRIVTWGWSRGGEASLVLASTFPQLVHAAVGYVPSAYVFPAPADPGVPAWTYRGRPLATGAIPVWKTSGPVFVVGGDDDRLWPSGDFVRQVEQGMREHGRRDVTALAYEGAGHMLYQAVPLQIETSAIGYGQVESAYGPLDFGGSPRADEAGLERSWPRLLRFLAAVGRR